MRIGTFEEHMSPEEYKEWVDNIKQELKQVIKSVQYHIGIIELSLNEIKELVGEKEQ